ncbi:hypothetical protein MNB_SV-14-1400 [hydrothermal vent metagenome]|uniref:General secretion pathway protein M n=1 Tax=hydrothermal vent metagenome TaxID=652676 RepID=A0A1W1BXS5_9ZZZZ
MSLKSSGFIPKLLFIGSLVLLFIWVVPKIFNYYQNSKNYDNKKNELKEMYSRYNILDKAEKFSLKAFKKDAESIFSDVRVEEKEDNEYVVVLQIEKNRIKEINSFIETLSLHYLVQIKDSELKFEDKNQMIELKFILEEL